MGTILLAAMNAAEAGRIPDFLIRHGIRRMLKTRLQTLGANDSSGVASDVIASSLDQPIAVRSDAANAQHYEVPARFFEVVLGSHLKYSSGFWPEGVNSLSDAEESALQQTCQHADVNDGMSILELGCGWGSLSLWMAEQYPNSQITAVSNSNSQRNFIEDAAVQRGLSNLRVVTADMNDFRCRETFDRVVSVEMFEHMRNHRELTNRIQTWLRPGGKLFVHVFCHRHSSYLFECDGSENWMGRHFFTGGMMPAVDLLPRACSALNLTDQWQWNGTNYARTCRAWLRNLDSATHDLRPVLASTYGQHDASRWHHRWRLFFMACEELFAFNGGKEWFVSHYLFEK